MEILMRTSTFATGRVELVSESGDMFILYVTIFTLRNTSRRLLGRCLRESRGKLQRTKEGGGGRPSSRTRTTRLSRGSRRRGPSRGLSPAR